MLTNGTAKRSAIQGLRPTRFKIRDAGQMKIARTITRTIK